MKFKLQRIKIVPILVSLIIVGSMFVFRAQFDVHSENLPILVNLSHMEFGDVFPGEQVQKTFTVSYSGSGDGKYTISEKYKPKPGAAVPDGYTHSISDYCQEYHDDFARCYRNLCPYIDVKSNENENDTMGNASVSANDPQDVWSVFLTTPAIIGKVTQEYNGKFVSETGEYGCDLSFDIGLPSAPICGNGKLEAGEECDDGNKIDNDSCSSICKTNKASISGCKYNDKNNNGQIDDGEGTLSGWEIQLIKCPYAPLATGASTFIGKGTISAAGLPGNCTVRDTTRTGEDGCYSFNNLDAGDYGINETGKGGWTQTYPLSQQYYYLNLTTGNDVKDINFLNHLDDVAPICGNGKTESGEECDDGNIADSDGCSHICKTEKCVDSGTVGKVADKVILDNGDNATADAAKKDDGKCAYQAVTNTQYINLEWNFDVPSGVDITSAKIDLKHAETGIDAFLEGWDGSKFVPVHELSESTKNTEQDFVVTSIVQKSGAKNIKFRLRLANPTQCHECLDWAYLELNYNKSRNCNGTISGCKYNDRNGNGKIDCGEEKLKDWEIKLIKCSYSSLIAGSSFFYDKTGLANNCWVVATTHTGDNGCYSFNNLEPGDYGVTETGESDWTQTFPATDKFYYFNLGIDKTAGDINFLNHKNEAPAPVCGNGKIESGEECDDSNTVSGDGCSNVCKKEYPVCGNAKLEPGEECDDGNINSGDGCSNICKKEYPVCGNGRIETGESCDDGNTTNGDGCSSTCTVESHGGGGGGGGLVCVASTINVPKVYDVTEVSAKFSWLTNKAADSRVICGQTSILGAKLKGKPDYGYDFTTSTYDLSPNVASHNLTVFELKPNTTYYCRVVSSTRCGETISSELSFKTLEHVVVTPPGQVKSMYVYNLTSTLPCPVQIGLKWKTNMNATTCVVYSTSSKMLGAKPLYGYDGKSAGCDNLKKLSTDHSIVLNLKGCTTYYFRLVATDGTLETVSEEQQLRTRCETQSAYYPRTYVAAAASATSKAATPAAENGQVKSDQTTATTPSCPACEVCQKAQDTVKTVVEKQRYLSTEDWLILFLILVALILLINALINRNRRRRFEQSSTSSMIGGGILGRRNESEEHKSEDTISEDEKF